MRILFFVHGTGVRGASYATTIQLVESKVRRFLPGFGFSSCAWYPYGAQLNKLGDSIPDYNQTGDVLSGLEESSLARWRILSEDPLLELRILSRDRTLGGAKGPQIWNKIEGLTQHPKVLALLKQWFLNEAWTTFLAGDPPGNLAGELASDLTGDLAADPPADLASDPPADPRSQGQDRWEGILNNDDWKDTVSALTSAPTAVSDRVARALVAGFQIYLREHALPGLAAAQRDSLRAVLIDPLGGPPMGGVKDWVLERFAGAGTNYTRRRRGLVMDGASPVVGDILRYQARGKDIRSYIRGEIEKCAMGEAGTEKNEVVILAHSLGGVACVDILAETALPCVTHLITAGSQAPYFYEINALVSREFGEGLGDNFKQGWLNFYDLRDFLSYRAAKIFPGKAVDEKVDNGQAFPESHGAYWHNDEQFWKVIADTFPSV